MRIYILATFFCLVVLLYAPVAQAQETPPEGNPPAENPPENPPPPPPENPAPPPPSESPPPPPPSESPPPPPPSESPPPPPPSESPPPPPPSEAPPPPPPSESPPSEPSPSPANNGTNTNQSLGSDNTAIGANRTNEASNQTTTEESSGVGAGGVAGIIIAVIAVVIGLGIVAFYFIIVRPRKREDRDGGGGATRQNASGGLMSSVARVFHRGSNGHGAGSHNANRARGRLSINRGGGRGVTNASVRTAPNNNGATQQVRLVERPSVDIIHTENPTLSASNNVVAALRAPASSGRVITRSPAQSIESQRPANNLVVTNSNLDVDNTSHRSRGSASGHSKLSSRSAESVKVNNKYENEDQGDSVVIHGRGAQTMLSISPKERESSPARGKMPGSVSLQSIPELREEENPIRRKRASSTGAPATFEQRPSTRASNNEVGNVADALEDLLTKSKPRNVDPYSSQAREEQNRMFPGLVYNEKNNDRKTIMPGATRHDSVAFALINPDNPNVDPYQVGDDLFDGGKLDRPGSMAPLPIKPNRRSRHRSKFPVQGEDGQEKHRSRRASGHKDRSGKVPGSSDGKRDSKGASKRDSKRDSKGDGKGDSKRRSKVKSVFPPKTVEGKVAENQVTGPGDHSEESYTSSGSSYTDSEDVTDSVSQSESKSEDVYSTCDSKEDASSESLSTEDTESSDSDSDSRSSQSSSGSSYSDEARTPVPSARLDRVGVKYQHNTSSEESEESVEVWVPGEAQVPMPKMKGTKNTPYEHEKLPIPGKVEDESDSSGEVHLRKYRVSQIVRAD